MRRNTLLFVLLAVIAVPQFVLAQGLLVDTREDQQFRLPRPIIWPPRPPRPIPRPRPQPPQSYKIKELGINVNLEDQIARVQMSQTFVNTGSRQMEVSFVFPLPYDGAVDSMTFMVDGKEYEAKLLNADEARRIYEGYVRRNQDPALVEWMGTGMFKTSVFPVPAGASRTVSIRYTQLCRKSEGMTELTFPLSTAKYTSHAVEKVTVNVNIRSQAKIKNVYSPTHEVGIKRPSSKHAVVSYEKKDTIPAADFRLMYDIGNKAVAARVLSYRPDRDEDGYFLLLVSPEIKHANDKVINKNVIFVVDRSGSMSGKKIEQAKESLEFVLNNLDQGDLFNIIAYDSAVESFKPEMQRFNEENRKEALGFIQGIYAGGSTNIDGALKAALTQLHDDSRPNYVIFLTDGLPTAGETNEMKIVENAQERNKVRTRVFSFGVGYDVNSRLLDKLARTCYGQSDYVRPDEDIEEYVSRLYNRIGAPVLTELSIKVDVEGIKPEDGNAVNRLYPRDAYDLFAGDQLVVVGRYKKPGDGKVTITGKVDGKQHKFDFPADLVKESRDESFAFVEKVWATRRVGEIIDEIDLRGKNQELVDELIKLSTRHGIITPYTSFLADENSNLRELAANRRQADVALERLAEAGGRGGFEQRRLKSSLQRAANAPAAAAPFGNANAVPADAFGLAEDEAKEEAAKIAQNVWNIGGKTFFLRDGKWVDSTLTEEQEKNVQKIARYGKDYFDLVSKRKDVAKYLATDREMIIVIDDQAYSF